MKKHFLLIPILSCLFSLCLSSQNISNQNNINDNVLRFHLFDVESGLSNNYINSIAQDSLGFMWIATADGLNRYDGFKFIKYTDKNHSGLSNNNIAQINYNKKYNALIIATDRGLNKFLPKYKKFEPFYNKNIITNEVINCFATDVDDNLIIATLRHNEGLHIVDKKGTVQSFTHTTNNNSISDNEISSLAIQNDSILWIGTFHGGVNKMNYLTKKNTRLGYENSKFSRAINKIYIDKEDNVWIGSKNGIQVITSTKDTLILKASLIKEKGLSDTNVLSFQEDDYGRMWIGTRNGGLNILDINSFFSKKREINIKWFLPKSDGTSIYNRTVSCIKKDEKGNMWLGTSTGVNFVNPEGESIKFLKNNSANKQSISHNRIGSLAQANNHKIWVGTDGGGLDLFNPKNGGFTHYKHSKNNQKSLSNNYIISLLEDSKERVWVGTYQGGLNLLNPKTSNSKKYLPGYDIRVIFEDKNKQIWIGTNRGGLFKFNEKKDTFDYINFLGKIDIRAIKQGFNNDLWMATFGDGIVWYNPIKNDAVFYNTNNTNGLKTNIFFSLLPLNNGDILLGSRYKGLIRLNPNTKETTLLSEENGLTNNTINSIVREHNNMIWLGTSNGINRYNLDENKIYNLGSLNNIQQKEFTIGAGIRSREGHLYFGSNKGLNIFYPEKLDESQKSYRLVFNDILVFNDTISIKPNTTKSILNKSISYENEITFNHNHSLFSIGFTVLKYPISKNISYSYILEGYQDYWVKLKGNTLANFSNTPPGNYTLKVKAILDSGEDITNQLSIIIKPPFWLTLPAYLIYSILIIIFTFFILKYYSERVQLKNSLLFEKKQRKLEHDLNEERIHFFTSFSHELKTPLTLILAPLDDLIKQTRVPKNLKNLHLIKRNATSLYRLINKLLVFRKSETGLSQLSIQKVNISDTLQQIKIDFDSLAKNNNISFNINLPKEDISAWIDLEKFQIIANNLISNAFNHCKEKESITLSLKTKENNFIFFVEDTGIGIDNTDLPYIFDWYFQSGKQKRKKGTGIGLALTKSFVELHKGSITAKNNDNNIGANFTVEIPIEELKPLNSIEKEKNQKNNSDIIWGAINNNIIGEKSKKIKVKQKRKLILLVDDNRDIIQYLESLLENEYDLIFSYNGQDGINKATKYIPDIIISDIMMPQKSGVDLCNFLKNQMSTTHIPIILLSAKESNESIKSGFEEGADAYITKPFNQDILISRIKNLLKNRNQLKEYFSAKEATLLELSSNNLKLLDKEKEFLKKLNSIILINLKNEKVNVNKLAQDIGMSRSSLFRKIKAITGKNINEYIRKVRIEKAAYLIKEEGTTISQASYEVGFNSVNYFRKVFKEELGILPSSLKENNSN